MGDGKVRIAVAGLGSFGRIWVSAYSALPDVAHVGICDPDEMRLRAIGDEFGIGRRHTQLDSDVICEMTASFHQLVRSFLSDRFYIYGNRMSFESAQVAGEDPVLFEAETGTLPAGQRSRKVSVQRVALPPLAELVPDEISEVVRDSRSPRGIPLAHEFVRSIMEDRPPAIDVATAANWTAAGVCAHASAMQGGIRIDVPLYP